MQERAYHVDLLYIIFWLMLAAEHWVPVNQSKNSMTIIVLISNLVRIVMTVGNCLPCFAISHYLLTSMAELLNHQNHNKHLLTRVDEGVHNHLTTVQYDASRNQSR